MTDEARMAGDGCTTEPPVKTIYDLERSIDAMNGAFITWWVDGLMLENVHDGSEEDGSAPDRAKHDNT